MTPRTVFLFSGQGSQYYQMGRALYDTQTTFRSWMHDLDDQLRKSYALSVVQTLYADERRRGDTFDRLLLTHPAIFMVEIALAQTLIAAGVLPHFVLGYSLGSYAAAAVAGMLDPFEALRAVTEQALAVEAHCTPAGMTAVLGPASAHAAIAPQLAREVAAVHYERHHVISAELDTLMTIERALPRSIAYQRLPVRYAFHSRWIDAAAEPLRAHSRTLTRHQGSPLLCCVRGDIVDGLSADYFWHVARQPVQFKAALARLDTRDGPLRFIDVGPSGTLATLLRYALPDTAGANVQAIMTPWNRDVQNLDKVVNHIQEVAV